MRKIIKFDKFNPVFLIQIRGCDDELYYLYYVDKHDINIFSLFDLFHDMNITSKKEDNFPCCPDVHIFYEFAIEGKDYYIPLREVKSHNRLWKLFYEE